MNNINTVLSFLKECGVFYLATTDNNIPKVRPFGIIDLIDNHLYMVTLKHKDVYKQIVANSRVQLCAMKSDGTWIRVNGNAISVDDSAIKDQLLAMNQTTYDIYSNSKEEMIALRIDNGSASISTENPEPICFNF